MSKDIKKVSTLLFLTVGLFILSFFVLQSVQAANQVPGSCINGSSAINCARGFMPKVTGLTDTLTFSSKSTGDTLIGKIGYIINLVLSFLGVIFLGLTIFSGIQWLWAGDNSEDLKKARQRLINSVIGLLIVLVAYGISYFVFTSLDTIITK